jgi:thiosulfate dehydrogenase [quinone] large subunit
MHPPAERPPIGGERNATIGVLLLRLFLGQFWILQMVGKARDQESGITSLGNLAIWARNTGDWMVKTTPLPAFAIRPFTIVLPYVELALGLCILLGLATRHALIASVLVLISLDVGLMFQLKHDVVALNTLYILAALLALHYQPANRFALDTFIGRR